MRAAQLKGRVTPSPLLCPLLPHALPCALQIGALRSHPRESCPECVTLLHPWVVGAHTEVQSAVAIWEPLLILEQRPHALTVHQAPKMVLGIPPASQSGEMKAAGFILVSPVFCLSPGRDQDPGGGMPELSAGSHSDSALQFPHLQSAASPSCFQEGSHEEMRVRLRHTARASTQQLS